MDSISTEGPRSLGTWLPPRRFMLVFAVLFGLGAIAVVMGHRLAHSALIDLGPTDEGYVQGFRDIERDGPLYVRWSSVPSSRLDVPIRSCGPGLLRLRVRRHFTDPAVLSVSFGGLVLGQRTVSAGQDHPYDVITFQYSEVTCDSDIKVLLESSVENERPLGVVVDWAEITALNGFKATSGSVVRGALFVSTIGLVFMLAGAGTTSTSITSAVLALLVALGFASNPIAAERFLRGGLITLVLVLTLGSAFTVLTGLRALSRSHRVALVAVTLVTLLSRAAFLHTQAFYPDYRVHALVQETMTRIGFPSFVDHLFDIQYARSLGLQAIGGHWYPFPYPPGSYLLTAAIATLFRLAPLEASLVTAATAASLIPALTMALTVSLGFGEAAGLAGAFYVALQPLLVRRMALGYFPGLTGQLLDAVALLLLIKAMQNNTGNRRPSIGAVLALLVSFLTYTQSIANFGLLVAGLLLLEMARPSPGGRRRVLLAALVATLALAAAGGAFYWRYIAVFENAAAGRPQPESRVLDRLEDLRRNAQENLEGPEADDLNDPWSGPTFNPARGLARLATRLWRFNGPLSLAGVLGFWFLLRASDRATRNLLLAWGGVAVWISLLAAGLPSPNGFQHLKDLEFVSPLIALAMGVVTLRLWRWRPIAGALLAGGWVVFAALAFAHEWSERLLIPSGR